MKGLQKKILIVLFVCIALFAFSAVGFAKTTDENGLDVQNFEYSLSAENKIHLQTVDGKNYLFLPASESDFDIRKLECGDLKPVWDGLKEEEKGKEKLKIDVGQTTEDGKFSIEETRCIGACGLAPVFTVNDEVYGKATPELLDKVIDEYMAKED